MVICNRTAVITVYLLRYFIKNVPTGKSMDEKLMYHVKTLWPTVGLRHDFMCMFLK